MRVKNQTTSQILLPRKLQRKAQQYFQGKVVVITGAGSGIGQALAWLLLDAGARLALTDISQVALAQLETELMASDAQASIYTAAVDVSDRAQVEQFSQQLLGIFGQVDGLLNVAGVAMGEVGFERLSLADFERVMAVNFWGIVHMSHCVLPLLKQRPQSLLVNVASIFALVGSKYASAYSASKFAVDGLTQALAAENLEGGLQVATVFPAGVKTNISANAVLKEKRSPEFERQLTMSPQQAASILLRGVLRGQRRIMIGRSAKALDVLQRLAPDFTWYLLNRFIIKKSM